MLFEIETLQTESFLVKHRVNAPSLRFALEQVRDRASDELQRTRIEDGELIISLEYAYFQQPVTFYGVQIKCDAIPVPIVMVEINLMALTEEIAAELRELNRNAQEVTDIRVGQLQAQSLSYSRQLVQAGEMIPLSDEELASLIQRLDAQYRDAVSSFCPIPNEETDVLREG